MPQSKEPKVLPMIQYILSLFHINYEFSESIIDALKCKWYTRIWKLSYSIGRSLYHKQSMVWHWIAIGVKVKSVTRLLTPMQVGDYWKYALEAIILYYFISMFIIKCLYFMLSLLWSWNMWFSGKIHMHVWNDKWIKWRFLVSPLRLAQVLLMITFSGS